MTTSEIRDELVSQHEGLRGHLDAARFAVEQWASGRVPRSEVCGELARLADALHAHNLYEERVLRDLVQSIESRGLAYDPILSAEHLREHREACDLLAHVSSLDPGGGGRELEKFCARLLAHMTWEEKALLNATVRPQSDERSSEDG
jgi:hypothetical protein